MTFQVISNTKYIYGKQRGGTVENVLSQHNVVIRVSRVDKPARGSVTCFYKREESKFLDFEGQKGWSVLCHSDILAEKQS